VTKALWNNTVVADSHDCVVVDGYHYFPKKAVRQEYLRESQHHTVCSWKGMANYYDVVVGGSVNLNAAWYYPSPSKAAERVAGRIAFWKGVEIEP